MKKHLAQSAVLITAALLLIGCGAESPEAPVETTPPAAVSDSVTQGVPEGWEDRIDNDKLGEQILTGWIDEGKTFAVVTWGSSTCVPVADSLEARSDTSLLLTFKASPNEVCTADMSPATHTFTLPSEVSKRPVELTVVLTETGQSDVSELS
ncbi:hypothetical protein QBL02_12800 [Leucobacter sp. UT-8R-CII-1-4]|uniref:hypothetical protein n=1 Tax=Leucobacter sp. UT-8R-CII-1-4 TaxID=3040075 RepID=UPI0024A9E7F9|nr:hypothetical protein [Leucobacter sp. UT-8R-CII-1-4]MDI6024421.1 hypothetical protein [Leucobacter sp. UT-8R-CII-1-4]